MSGNRAVSHNRDVGGGVLGHLEKKPVTFLGEELQKMCLLAPFGDAVFLTFARAANEDLSAVSVYHAMLAPHQARLAPLATSLPYSTAMTRALTC